MYGTIEGRVKMNDNEFLERWHYWKFALGSENPEKDPNTLVNQMSSMVWDIGVFKSTMISWGKELYDGSDDFKVTPVLFHFLFDNFFKSLCLSIRRITDMSELEDKRKSNRSVISIPSLLGDIKKHRTDYTRKRLFLAVDFEYNNDIIQKKHDEYANQFSSGQVFVVPRDLNPSFCISEHKLWDELSGITADSRSESDIIGENYIDNLLRHAKGIKKEIEFVTDKYFAHASTPESRTSIGTHNATVSLARLVELVVDCGRLVNSISNILSDAVWPFMPTAQFDKWDNWGIGWKANSEELEKEWHDWGNQVERLEHIPIQ